MQAYEFSTAVEDRNPLCGGGRGKNRELPCVSKIFRRRERGRMVTQEQETIARKVLDCAYEVHSYLGPVLLESTYQACL
jgi:hypothetical protein